MYLYRVESSLPRNSRWACSTSTACTVLLLILFTSTRFSLLKILLHLNYIYVLKYQSGCLCRDPFHNFPVHLQNTKYYTVFEINDTMDIYHRGSRLGEITSSGDVYISGCRVGDIDSDVYVQGSREGYISGEDLYIHGSREGYLRSDGDMYVGGNRRGCIEDNGDVYVDGCRWGCASTSLHSFDDKMKLFALLMCFTDVLRESGHTFV